MKFSGGTRCFFFVTLAAKKRAHKYRAEATSDRLVKATRAVHASHPRKPVTTDSALISRARDSWRTINHAKIYFRRVVSPSPSLFPPPAILSPFAAFRLGASVIAE